MENLFTPSQLFMAVNACARVYEVEINRKSNQPTPECNVCSVAVYTPHTNTTGQFLFK